MTRTLSDSQLTPVTNGRGFSQTIPCSHAAEQQQGTNGADSSKVTNFFVVFGPRYVPCPKASTELLYAPNLLLLLPHRSSQALPFSRA
jgi:hypothetical protein